MIELYLGSTLGGWARDGQVEGWSSHDDAPDALSRWMDEIVERQATRWRKPPVTLWLSGGLARPFLCGPVDGLTNWREAEAVASAMAPDATGLEGACHVFLESWPRGSPVLATAISAALSERIAELARTRRIAWRSVRPRWAAALDEALQYRPALRLLALEEPDAVTVLGGGSVEDAPRTDAAFDHAATHAPSADANETFGMWQRTLLSRDVSVENASFSRLRTSMSLNAGSNASAADAPQVDAERTRIWPAAVLDGVERQP